ncbi:hypothetical protein DEIPH_ctg032orf0051 [Deinococcus phoenicis]|uniref:PatA-like N-terminal domain-containing protein n=1 Tax=Deinococcus phoenicis TaxID=1476583 RepID=A0A016QP02_9DEIO|nr:DUF4388 domain-containing protein [Deinococcus phoenicis]EYB67808.1 hypothetical protein DEIPH_ctg032orf0051 [Deinococcus phoenicis]
MVRGDLAVFPFMPVMQMLLSSGRAGRLSVSHARGGELWFEPGEIVHARAGALTGEAALQVMSSLDSGQFTFAPDVPPTERTLALRRDAALRRLIDDADAWAGLLRVFPDWNRPLRFTPRWTEAQPVTRPQYAALCLISEALPLKTLLERAGQPPRVTLETLRPFLTAGLVEVG